MEANEPYILFSATGCIRCKAAKSYMTKRGIAFQEQDIKAEGQAFFQHFYREHRAEIRRGPDGVEFPILFDGERLVQGVGEILARLQAGDHLAGFVGWNTLGHGWIDGLDLSAGDPSANEAFLVVLRHLKEQGLQTEIRADGRNGNLLERVIAEGLASRLVFDPVGPAERYETALGVPLDPDALRQSLALAAKAPEVRFVLTLRSLGHAGEEVDPITPEEAGRVAEMTAMATGNRQLPFFIQAGKPEPGQAPLPKEVLFKIRTACRRHMPRADILSS
jgi:pyruvate formate lyase activating enzyme